jgi:hypothetical protein
VGKITVTASDDPRDLVRVAQDLLVPKVTTVAVSGLTEPDYDVEVDVAPQGGRLVVREVRVRQSAGGPPVTGEGLRAVPVASLAQWAARKVQRVISERPEEMVTQPAGVHDEDVEYVKANGPTDRTLQIVAHTYRMALLMGRQPTKMTEEWLEIPRSTAGRWVASARTKGFLSAAEGPGKAGG